MHYHRCTVVVLWWPSGDWLLPTHISLLSYFWNWRSCWLHHAALWPCSTHFHKRNSIAWGDIRWQGTRPSHHRQEVEEKMSHVCLLYSTWTICLHLLFLLLLLLFRHELYWFVLFCISLPSSLFFFFTPLLFNRPHSSLFLLHPITYLSLEAMPTDKSPPLVATSKQQSLKTLQDYGGKSHCLSLLLSTIAIFPSPPTLSSGRALLHKVHLQ